MNITTENGTRYEVERVEPIPAQVLIRGAQRRAIRVYVSGDDISIMGGSVVAIDDYANYIYKGDTVITEDEEVYIIVGAKTAAERQQEEKDAAITEIKEQSDAKYNSIIDFAKASGVSDVDINVVTQKDAYPQWELKKWAVNDVVEYKGIVYYCTTAYDGTVQTNWTPATAHTYWYRYHGKTPQTAVPWFVQNASDAYAIGEYCVFDGKIYKSKANANVHSPSVVPANWELVR
jgi:hypothetical protein